MALSITSSFLTHPETARLTPVQLKNPKCEQQRSRTRLVCNILQAKKGATSTVQSLSGHPAAQGRGYSEKCTRRVLAAALSGNETESSVDKDELLKDAAKAGDMAALDSLLLSGEVDVNLPSPLRSGWTALHLGAFYGHNDIIQRLLQAGADTEVRNKSGNTALQFACIKGNVDAARILLEAGADIYAMSDDKGTALDYAQEWGTEETVDFLLVWAATHPS